MVPKGGSFAASLAALAALAEGTPLMRKSANPAHETRDILSKRAVVTSVQCGLFATAYGPDTTKNYNNLKSKGGSVTVGGNGCTRIGCYNTSGVYVCSTQDSTLVIEMADIVTSLGVLERTCTAGSLQALSGQTFSSDQGGYNVNIGFCDGNEPSSSSPSQYSQPGPNGNPGVTCGSNGGTPCPNFSCQPGSVQITSQNTVTCNEYLGPIYVGAGNTESYSTTKSIATTWSVGGNLGINIASVFNAGFTSSYSQQATVGTTTGVTGQCGNSAGSNGQPGNWTCGIDITPRCGESVGTCTLGLDDGSTSGSVSEVVPYTVQVPLTNGAGGDGVFGETLCLCKNCDGWADRGAPSIPFCNLPCSDCLHTVDNPGPAPTPSPSTSSSTQIQTSLTAASPPAGAPSSAATSSTLPAPSPAVSSSPAASSSSAAAPTTAAASSPAAASTTAAASSPAAASSTATASSPAAAASSSSA